MTDKKKPIELEETDLDDVAGGGEPVARYELQNAWPSKVTDDSRETLKNAETSKIVAEGGGSGI